MRHYFKYGTSARVITAIGVIAFVCFLYGILTMPYTFRWLIVLNAALALFFIVPILLSPIYYEVNPDGVQLRLVACSIFFPASRYEVAPEPPIWDQLTVWWLGTGGYFGYLGWFGMKGGGSCYLLLTAPKEPVLAIRDKKSKRVFYINRAN
ncbi:MAG: hypothetical protein Q4A64_03985 [Porphyromonadaceae bacterium]|nr:hypothetical protein [Porphyromonadaceae bacterium]